ncbi:sodium-dependent bicarbonate transport family permease [bacterium]|nr:sodium-dependent bicarbonate transport family permease [bacterium]
METLELIQHNLLSPIVLAFVLGMIATLLHSDLRMPDDIYTALSIYLLFAIGLKGGAELSETSVMQVIWPALATVSMGVFIPVWCYFALRKIGRLSAIDAAAIAAHYGSVSAVTFIATLNFLERQSISYEGYMPALMAMLEVPAIVVALGLANVATGRVASWKGAMHEILTGKSVLLLVGGVTVGMIAGHHGYEQVAPFFQKPFKGILCLFLLEMGMVAARRLSDLKTAGVFLIAFALIAPVINGMIGVVAGHYAGLSVGGTTVFGVLCASASYIAATAAVRVSLPEANPSYYLTTALAVTFPFNLTIGIPLFLATAQSL